MSDGVNGMEVELSTFPQGEKMGRIEQELRALEEFMKEIIEKAPAIMEQMKRMADIGRPFAEEVKDRSYPHCDETECDFREGSGLYCVDKKCVSRIILVDYAGSFREDPNPRRRTAADDIAKEQWGWGMGGEGLYVVNDDGSMTLLATASHLATPEQVATMAAAPEMLDVLMAVDRARQSGSIDLNGADDEEAARLFAQIRGVIAKARGEENKDV